MLNFNLIKEPWMPVQTLRGEPHLLGLEETLVRAHEFKSLDDASPLVVASLHRLLLAVLHRACSGPTSYRLLQQFLKAGRFDETALSDYLSKHQQRFDLFGEAPFYQVGDLELSKDASVAKLAVECSSGNNKALFDHSRDDAPPSLSFAEAARWLVAHQAFALCGGVSGGGLINFTDAPSPRGVVVLVTGANLFETLLANLVPYSDEKLAAQDLAVWERPALTFKQLQQRQKHAVTGPVNLYTWQSRAVRLLPVGECVARMFYTSAYQAVGSLRDPAVAYLKPKKQDADYLPVKFLLGKGFWRDFGTLVPPEGDLRPQVINHSYRLGDDLAPRGILKLMLLGQLARPGKPVVDAWRSERYPLPTRVLENDRWRNQLLSALELAEGAGQAVRAAGYTLAVALTDTEAAGNLLASLPLLKVYWSRLEAAFATFLTRLGESQEPDGAYIWWRKVVRETALDAFEVTRRAVGAKGRRALIAGERRLYIELGKIGLKREREVAV